MAAVRYPAPVYARARRERGVRGRAEDARRARVRERARTHRARDNEKIAFTWNSHVRGGVRGKQKSGASGARRVDRPAGSGGGLAAALVAGADAAAEDALCEAARAGDVDAFVAALEGKDGD